MSRIKLKLKYSIQIFDKRMNSTASQSPNLNVPVVQIHDNAKTKTIRGESFEKIINNFLM